MCLCVYVKKQTVFVFIFLFYVVLIEVSSEKIFFPDELNNYKEESNKHFQEKPAKRNDKEDGEIPIDLIQKLNSIQNASELFNDFIVKDTGKNTKGGIFTMASRLRTSPYVSDRSGGVEEEITASEITFLASSNNDAVARHANIKMAPPAICKPELHTIPLYTPEDRRIFAFPSCTRVERCGGCCQHELLSCQPTKTETLNYQVILMEYVGNNKFNNIGKEIVPVEKHTACKCLCITKKEHCTPLQEYIESDCKCVCTNKDEEQKCSADSNNRLWDPHSCTCKCRDIGECGSGQFFSDATCGCQAIRAATGSSKEDRINYNVYKLITPYSQRNERYQA